MKQLRIVVPAILLVGLIVFIVGCNTGGNSPITPGKASAVKIVFTRQPEGGSAGTALPVPPAISIQDEQGNRVTDYRGIVTLTITPGTGNGDGRLLGGTRTSTNNGQFEFSQLTINKAGTGYTLTAASGSLTAAVSAPFSITSGPPAKLFFSVEPTAGQVGQALTPDPEVTVQDSYGNTVTSFDGTIALGAKVGYVDYSSQDPNMPQQQPQIKTFPIALQGQTTVSAVGGVAHFSDISTTMSTPVEPGFMLVATSDFLASTTSTPLAILPGEPVKLEFSAPPDYATAGMPFDGQPSVLLEDTYGNVVTTSRASITVAITPGTGTAGAVLSGTTTLIAQDAYGGLAGFSDLSIDLPGSGYTLTATSPGLPPVQSQAFDVVTP